MRRRAIVDTEIVTRTGRIIVDQTNIVSFGSGRGAVLTSATTARGRELAIAGGSTSNGRRETLELVNPGATAASVTISIVASTATEVDLPEVVPVQIDVAAGARAQVDLATAGSPSSGGYSLVIGATSAIVASRRATARIASATAFRPAVSPAVSSVSTEWIAATADGLTIFNLSSASTTAQVERLDGTKIVELRVGPGQSREYIPSSRETVRVVADLPILVSRRIVSTGSTPGWSLPVAVATAEGLAQA